MVEPLSVRNVRDITVRTSQECEKLGNNRHQSPYKPGGTSTCSSLGEEEMCTLGIFLINVAHHGGQYDQQCATLPHFKAQGRASRTLMLTVMTDGDTLVGN